MGHLDEVRAVHDRQRRWEQANEKPCPHGFAFAWWCDDCTDPDDRMLTPNGSTRCEGCGGSGCARSTWSGEHLDDVCERCGGSGRA